MFIFSVLPVCRQIMLNIFQQLRTKCGQREGERLKMLNLEKILKFAHFGHLPTFQLGHFHISRNGVGVSYTHCFSTGCIFTVRTQPCFLILTSKHLLIYMSTYILNSGFWSRYALVQLNGALRAFPLLVLNRENPRKVPVWENFESVSAYIVQRCDRRWH